MNLKQFALVVLGAAAAAVVVQCGGSPSSPSGPQTPPPTTTTTTLPSNGLPAGMVCDPTPPPVLYVLTKMHAFGGDRNILDSAPQVTNVDGYCGKVGFDPRQKFCFTRPEGDLQRVACDYLATGRAKDTGRWGPTWYYEGRPCAPAGQAGPCQNDPDNQFMAIAKADGEFAACIYPSGSERICGTCTVIQAKGQGCEEKR
jgi:hypothetical protein